MTDATKLRGTVDLLVVMLACLCCGWDAPAALGQANVPLEVAKATPNLRPITSDVNSTPTADDTEHAIEQVDVEVPLQEETSGEALAEKHKEVASKLRVAMLQEQAQKASEPANTQPKASESEVDLLKQIDVIVAQQKSATATLQDIQVDEDRLRLRLSKLADNQLTEDPPYSITMVDQLRDSIKSLKAKEESLQESLTAARDAVKRARVAVEEQQRDVRQLKERNPDVDLKIPNLEVRLAEEMLVLRRQELATEEASELIRSLQLNSDEKTIEIIVPKVTFSQEMLNEQIADLDARESELKRKADSLQTELQYAERRWLVARQEVDSTASPGPDLLERVDALKTSQQALQQELAVTNQRLQRTPMIRTAWERRYLVVAGIASREQRRDWLEETVKQIEQLARERRSRELKLQEVRGSLTSVNAKLDATSVDQSEVKRWVQTKQAALNKQSETLTSSIVAIDTATRTLERLRVQIDGEKRRTVSDWIADTWLAVRKIWNYELTHTEDASVTVGEVLSSVLLLFIGFFAAKWISLLLGKRLPKLGVDEAGVSVIESLSFYALLITFGLAALKYANVPLTVFTFLGGAIAIGVGFGSQNIINNFISGLILLAERPIKKGDLIQLDDMHGNIVKIGARSTQIRTGENLDIIVPNSKFLENNVTNLTRKDDRLRTSITVGVAYGSPLDQVVALLKQAATESADVQDRPEPMIWFNDFGDNSLVFQVNFWIKTRTLAQMRRVETDVRLNIDRLFREHGVVIAFPQRDLHIQTPRPIELRLTGNNGLDDVAVRAAG